MARACSSVSVVARGGALLFALFAGALLLLLLLALPGSPVEAATRTDLDLVQDKDPTICTSRDIRNNIRSFERLRGCRIVEGFVQILLFDNALSLFANVSFPELTEITDFLLLYRVNGLKSIGQLFPNLAVIRGQDTVFGYSFIVYEMSSLEEIGLRSLTNIEAGLIRIDRNPLLCHVNSIDWNLIARDKHEHVIRNSKPEGECPLCPGDDGDSGAPNQPVCPLSVNGRHLCWNRQHCQKVCPAKCRSNTCDANGDCCDDECMGGCQVGTVTKCAVCRRFTLADGSCADHCPPGSYEYLDRRCVTYEQCINFERPIKMHSKIQHTNPFKIYKNRSCLLECPANHMANYTSHTCEECHAGRCKKECQGAVIDSVLSAQQLRGCTYINGSLEIQIRGGKHIVNELEENLNMIEEIDGYLKIVRSFPLVSLNFLKSLRAIHGMHLDNRYALVVLDNQNLQEIWNWENRTLTIGNGILFFHFNPRLCLDIIDRLIEKANILPGVKHEISQSSNGDKIACNVKDLVVNITKIYSGAVVLEWPTFEVKDHRKLLGYVVYSIRAPYNNITLYDGRDACGGDGWRVDDVPVSEQDRTTHIITQLEPYTQYAFYVKTYTIANELSGAQSEIYYFRTLPGQPTPPVDIKLQNRTTNSLTIVWKPPKQPNGHITYYSVTYVRQVENRTQIENQRNYCNVNVHKEVAPKIEHSIVAAPTNGTCQCDDDIDPNTQKAMHAKDADTRSNDINFEDELYNFVYLKNSRKVTKDTELQSDPSGRQRRRRNLDETEFPYNNTSKSQSVESSDILNRTDPEFMLIAEGDLDYKVNKTEITIEHLKHYTDYKVQVRACRKKERKLDDNCSQASITTLKTEKKDDADNITNVRFFNKSSNTISLSWTEPVDPNGPAVAYQIEYKRLDRENSQPTLECIAASQYRNSSNIYILEKLNPGNYSLRVYTKTQAGEGLPSAVYTFQIEETSSNVSTIIVTVVCIIIVLVLCLLAFYRRQCLADKDIKMIATVNPEYVSTVYTPDEWEMARDRVKMMKELGQGSFGMVYEGLVKDAKGKTQNRCAIKTVNEHATNRERIEFLNEASVMKAFDTAHVVRLLGVVSQGQPTLVVMELMANGDLKTYLRSHRPDSSKSECKQLPTLKRILQMAIEIADGMSYLAAMKFVHRDLAARNCMVAEDLTVKIGDFGMTRDVYETDYYRKGTKGLLPVRWMAPESLQDGVFSSSTDVWSYGVVLWEMATLASQPYPGMSNDQVLRYVIDGAVMQRPENCPDKLYELMHSCWMHKPQDRPSFMELCALLIEDAPSSFAHQSYYHSAAGLEARNSRSASSLDDDAAAARPLRSRCSSDEETEDDDELVAVNGFAAKAEPAV